MDAHLVEDRIPYVRSFDVLIQYLITLAVSDGFKPDVIWSELKQTFSYQDITEEEFQWCCVSSPRVVSR